MAADLTYVRRPSTQGDERRYYYEPDDEVEAPEEAKEEDECPTGHTCESCEEDICLDEDMVLVQLVVPMMNADEGLVHYETLFGQDGEPLVAPLYLHYPCFEGVAQDVEEVLQDTPPIEEDGTILSCDCCGSSIRMGEVSCTLTMGELIESPRMPGTITFLKACNKDGSPTAPYVICIGCIPLLADAVLSEAWSGISQKGECPTCSLARCWRAGRCDCNCHL